MSFLRVLCYPVKALGSVTINGSVITRGETIQQFGELRIDLGSYRQDDIALYNDAQQWTPVSVDDNVLVFNLQSNGEFYIYDNARRIVFDFSNDMLQDFAIDEVRQYDFDNQEMRQLWSKGSYAQVQWSKDWERVGVAVKSNGKVINELAVSGSPGATVVARSPLEGYDDTWRFLTWVKPDKQPGEQIQIKVGNVLVANFVVF